MNVRMANEELYEWRKVAATLMLNGVLKEATISALVRYGLRLVVERHGVTLKRGAE